MIATIEAARKLLAREKALPMRRLVEEIAGEPVRGSWWGHRAGARIYAIASELEDDADVLCAKLIDGKVTFVHRALFAPLYRVVTDEEWRRGAAHGLERGGRALLRRVEQAGEVGGVEAGDKRARAELERRALIHSAQVHTETGAHATVLRSWRAWGTREIRASARRWGLAEARVELSKAGISL